MSTDEIRSWNFSTLNRSIQNLVNNNTGILSNFIAGTVNNTSNTSSIDNVVLNKIESGTISSNDSLTINKVSNLYIEGPIEEGSNTTINI